LDCFDLLDFVHRVADIKSLKHYVRKSALLPSSGKKHLPCWTV